jgi:hypothetical protein
MSEEKKAVTELVKGRDRTGHTIPPPTIMQKWSHCFFPHNVTKIGHTVKMSEEKRP